MSHKYYHKNKACCILMGIKNFAKNICILLLSLYVWIKLTKKQRNTKFSWELEQNMTKIWLKYDLELIFVTLFKHLYSNIK